MVTLSITTSVYDVMDEIQRQTILGGSSEFYHLACALGALLCAVYLVQLSAKVLSGSGAWRPGAGRPRRYPALLRRRSPGG